MSKLQSVKNRLSELINLGVYQLSSVLEEVKKVRYTNAQAILKELIDSCELSDTLEPQLFSLLLDISELDDEDISLYDNQIAILENISLSEEIVNLLREDEPLECFYLLLELYKTVQQPLGSEIYQVLEALSIDLDLNLADYLEDEE